MSNGNSENQPVHVNNGVWVFRSQKRTVVSPEPLANCFPSGLKDTERTASPWPAQTRQFVFKKLWISECGNIGLLIYKIKEKLPKLSQNPRFCNQDTSSVKKLNHLQLLLNTDLQDEFEKQLVVDKLLTEPSPQKLQQMILEYKEKIGLHAQVLLLSQIWPTFTFL